MQNSVSLPSLDRGVTLRDVAEAVGVSVQSVSGVLNEGGTPKRVSPHTRQRILEVAEELGYRRNHSARAMRTGDTRMLGFLGGDLSEEHVGKMLSGAVEAADACGYTLKILRLGDLGNAQQVIRRSSELRLMGVLALHLPALTQADLHAEARRYGYPLVLMDARSDRKDIPQVVSDDEAGIREGVRHLVELGHRRIAFLSAQEDSEVLSGGSQKPSLAGLAHPRQKAFLAAMAHHDLEVAPELIACGSFSTREVSLQAAHILLSLPSKRRPTAIFCAGDFIALAALQAAQKRGIVVPDQLSLIGFANLGVLDFVTPRLTTIEQPFLDIGRSAVHVLLRVIESQGKQETGSSETPPNSLSDESCSSVSAFNGPLFLPTRLLQRESTAPPPQKASL